MLARTRNTAIAVAGLALVVATVLMLAGRPSSTESAAAPPTQSPSPKRVRGPSVATSRGTSTDHVIAGHVTGLPAGVTARVEARRVGDCPKAAVDETTWEPSFLAPPNALPTNADGAARADGSFELLVSAAGTYLVSARMSDGREASREVEVPEPLPRVEVEIAAHAGSFSLRGRVVRADGAPFHGWLHLVEHEESGVELPPNWTAPGPDGRFEFLGLDAGTWDVEAVVPGESRTTALCVTTPRIGELVITVGAGALLTGRVVADADGTPIVGARVFANLALGEAGEHRWTTSDAAGVFAVHAETIFAVYADAPGFGVAWWVRDERAAAADVVVRLPRSGAILGRVLRSSDGSPVAGAIVLTSERLGSPHRTTSAADGSYRIDGVQPGRCDVFVLGGGWASVALATWSKGDYEEKRDDPYSVDVAAGSVEACDLRVEPTVRIEGRVISPTGDALRAAKVELDTGYEEKKGPRWRVPATTWTAADGTFEFADLPPGDGRSLTATNAGLPPARANVVCRPGDTSSVELRFDAPQRLDVTVTSSTTSAPISNARIDVYVVTETSCCGTSCGGATDGDGRCVLVDSPPGRLAVGVKAAGFVALNESHPFPAIQDAADPLRWRADVRLEPAFVISGRVVHADGTPAANFGLRLTSSEDVAAGNVGSESADADDAGAFRFEGLPAGTYSLTEWANLRDAPLATVVAGGPEVVVHLPPEPKPEGQIDVTILGAGGETVGVTVCDHLRQRGGRGWWEHGTLSLRADDGGDGCYLAIYGACDAAGNPMPFGATIVPLPEKLPNPLEIRLPPERVASGRAIGSDGRGVAGIRLLVRFADRHVEDEIARVTETAADGAFEIHQLGEGAYRLEVEPSKSQSPPPPILIRGGQKDILVDLSAGSSLVSVLDWDGKPVRGAAVDVWATKPKNAKPDEKPLVHVVTGPDGTARVNGIVPGTERALVVSGPANRDDLAWWTASPWTPKGAEIRLERACPVRGIVIDSDGKPQSMMTIDVSDTVGRPKIETGVHGRFVVPGLRRGETRMIRALRYYEQSDAAVPWTTVTAGDADVRLVVAPPK